MIVGVVKESFPGERRVALVPDLVPMLAKRGYEVVIQAGAGTEAGFLDAAYEAKGAQVLAGRDDVFAKAEILVHVRMGGANPERGADDLPRYREGQVVIGAADPLSHPEAIRALAERGVHAFGLELIPRTTRAQAMDILSSMATVAGYRAVLWAADRLPKFFPMFMTAAGTVAPAKVFIVGAGVAGLQAIATAKRLGAVVSAYDVRPAVKEEVESLGGKFVEMELETAEGEGGYAKAMDEAFYERQREMMLKVVAESDVVITTAAIPGRKAPILVTAEMVAGMAPGSVIVDLAAERGGNCELTRVDEVVESGGVTILGPSNVPSSLPYHASQMVSRNAVNFLLNMLSKPENPRDRDHVAVFDLEQEDDIMAGTWMTKGGEVVHEAVLEKLGATTEGQA
ncbi:MAG: Re/Si-specific NAD(P)(+) transhydrogenase subunit alpha [Planctomycetota bacterium]|nr:Re/Si-specific NAD(P)(+) transhydrogenase subunit alpha [Planctomycetota bacterium]